MFVSEQADGVHHQQVGRGGGHGEDASEACDILTSRDFAGDKDALTSWAADRDGKMENRPGTDEPTEETPMASQDSFGAKSTLSVGDRDYEIFGY